MTTFDDRISRFGGLRSREATTDRPDQIRHDLHTPPAKNDIPRESEARTAVSTPHGKRLLYHRPHHRRLLEEPLRFIPYFRPQVWGGRRLHELLLKDLPSGESIGESWELSAQPLHVSQVGWGRWQGALLTDLWDQHRDEFLGQDASVARIFPWLIKCLDCTDRFSVQVHPNNFIAQQLLNEPLGKTESWIILQAKPTSRIYAGLKEGVTRTELETRAQEGTIIDCLHCFVPKAGDCIHIPAGTIHAASDGVVFVEVQQTSDATFRLFDWNRLNAQGQPRTLHIAQALQAINDYYGPVSPVQPKVAPSPAPGVRQELLVQCDEYRLDRYQVDQSWRVFGEELSAWILLNGTAKLQAEHLSPSMSLHSGDVVLIPASVTTYTWILSSGSASLLQIRLPGRHQNR